MPGNLSLPVTLHALVASTAAHPQTIAKRVIRNPEFLPALFEGLDHPQARMRYGCLRILQTLSTLGPRVLYPSFERVAALLDHPNNVLRWGALQVLANLAAIDTEHRIDALLNRYLRPVRGPALVAAANAIRGAGLIAAAKPHLAPRIARALLTVESGTYRTSECRNVLLGHVIQSLELLVEHLKDPGPARRLAERQMANPRAAVRRKAKCFLKHLTPGSPARPWTRRQKAPPRRRAV